MDNQELQELEKIPGVGKTIAGDFFDIGIKKVKNLKNKNPEKLYKQICKKRGVKVDKCMLYVCRSSIYFANHKKHNQRKLKWWNWKNKK